MQTNLFQNDACAPSIVIDGLRHLPEYIADEEEARLIDIIDQQPWRHDLKRRVQHYGYRYDYKARMVALALNIGALPDWAAAISARLVADKWMGQKPDQLIVNEYLPGQGIAPHIDCIPCFSDTIISLSLAGPCVMDFSNPVLPQKTSLLLQPRDLIILSGAARYRWQHGIAARKSDLYDGQKINRQRRISLTFRKVILT
ncbi:MAG: alpha-ketoglutarate-dependent dioxygenase AlkB [Alphaproteobacteria bacterium]|nr:alpha-ketoglutarate-dependent dioxygenase AlkB [Alphaproteobacteria bacterium]